MLPLAPRSTAPISRYGIGSKRWLRKSIMTVHTFTNWIIRSRTTGYPRPHPHPGLTIYYLGSSRTMTSSRCSCRISSSASSLPGRRPPCQPYYAFSSFSLPDYKSNKRYLIASGWFMYEIGALAMTKPHLISIVILYPVLSSIYIYIFFFGRSGKSKHTMIRAGPIMLGLDLDLDLD